MSRILIESMVIKKFDKSIYFKFYDKNFKKVLRNLYLYFQYIIIAGILFSRFRKHALIVKLSCHFEAFIKIAFQ